MIWRRRVTKIFWWTGVRSLLGGSEMFQKRGGKLIRKQWREKKRACDPHCTFDYWDYIDRLVPYYYNKNQIIITLIFSTCFYPVSIDIQCSCCDGSLWVNSMCASMYAPLLGSQVATMSHIYKFTKLFFTFWC